MKEKILIWCKNRLGCLIPLGIFFIFMICFSIYSVWYNNTPEGKKAAIEYEKQVIAIEKEQQKQGQLKKEQEQKDSYLLKAVMLCEDAVKNSLKTPATAEFPVITESKYQDIGNNTFVVASYVDNENVYGAKVRNNYNCTIKMTGNNSGMVQKLNFY